jgi:hypothetical protein
LKYLYTGRYGNTVYVEWAKTGNREEHIIIDVQNEGKEETKRDAGNDFEVGADIKVPDL